LRLNKKKVTIHSPNTFPPTTEPPLPPPPPPIDLPSSSTTRDDFFYHDVDIPSRDIFDFNIEPSVDLFHFEVDQRMERDLVYFVTGKFDGESEIKPAKIEVPNSDDKIQIEDIEDIGFQIYQKSRKKKRKHKTSEQSRNFE